ncbi:MAG TPA: DNA-deoxyinosine glycosylase [bacterium]|nr:DNA-deoxyinosine glycosylase [bacterium]
MARKTGFPPILPDIPRILILGSMPGEESLRQQQYYAHPRNAFWPIMGALLGAGPDLDYAQRAERLRAEGVVLWDVLKQCEREGSLDTRIRAASEVPNAIAPLLRRHPGIRHVFFNGGKAAAAFRKHVISELTETVRERLTLRTLPSTSPANARMTLEEKCRVWRRELAVGSVKRKVSRR